MRAELLIDERMVIASEPILACGPGNYTFNFGQVWLPEQTYGIRYAFKAVGGEWKVAIYNSTAWEQAHGQTSH